MGCYHKILHITYKDHVTNEEVRAKIQQAIRPDKDLLTFVKRRKLLWYGHVSRSSGLAKTILQGTVKGGRRQGRQRKRWEDTIREWTSLEFGKSQRAVENREKMEKTGCKIICGAPTTLAVKGLMMMMMMMTTTMKGQFWLSHVPLFLQCRGQTCPCFPTKFESQVSAKHKHRLVDKRIQTSAGHHGLDVVSGHIVHGLSAVCLAGSVAESETDSNIKIGNHSTAAVPGLIISDVSLFGLALRR